MLPICCGRPPPGAACLPSAFLLLPLPICLSLPSAVAAQSPPPPYCRCLGPAPARPPACRWRSLAAATHQAPSAHKLLARNWHRCSPAATTHLPRSGLCRSRSSVPASHLPPPVFRRPPRAAALAPVAAARLAFCKHPHALPTYPGRSSTLVCLAGAQPRHGNRAGGKNHRCRRRLRSARGGGRRVRDSQER